MDGLKRGPLWCGTLLAMLAALALSALPAHCGGSTTPAATGDLWQQLGLAPPATATDPRPLKTLKARWALMRDAVPADLRYGIDQELEKGTSITSYGKLAQVLLANGFLAPPEVAGPPSAEPLPSSSEAGHRRRAPG